jgi:D-xylose transport system substrate-binding protein
MSVSCLAACTESRPASRGTKTSVAKPAVPKRTSATKSTVDATTTISDTVAVAETAPTAPAGGRIGFILPNSSEKRWETRDRLAITAACKAAEIECDFRNAEGSASKVAPIAQELIVGGAKVIVAVPFNGPAFVEMQEKTAAAGIGTIDYERLTANGKPDAYIAFDFEAIGKAHAEALITCFGPQGSGAPKRTMALHSDPATFNVELFRKGFNAAGAPTKLQISTVVPAVAGNTTSIDTAIGRLTPPNALAITVDDWLETGTLMKSLVKTTTGQAFTVAGLQPLLEDRQCAVIFKDLRAQADAVVSTAISMMRGDGVSTSKTINNGGTDVPYVAVPVRTLTKASLKSALEENLFSRSDLCRNQEALCKSLGL